DRRIDDERALLLGGIEQRRIEPRFGRSGGAGGTEHRERQQGRTGAPQTDRHARSRLSVRDAGARGFNEIAGAGVGLAFCKLSPPRRPPPWLPVALARLRGRGFKAISKALLPSSSGPGRRPLTAKTGVRVP